jgi:chromate reductase, NAD(P)H dehydrogenase (quinone)
MPMEVASPVRIAALVGSSRRASLNGALLRAARTASPAGVVIEPLSLEGIPFYDADLDASGTSEHVRAFRAAVAGSDGLLLVTPEYNRSLPAILKNAIDWASRPRAVAVLAGRPVLLIGATSGRSGVKYALQHAADVLAVAGAIPFERRYGLSLAGNRLDAAGELSDGALRADLADLLADFAAFSEARREMSQAAA